jgi:hypothetical protein
MPNPRRHSHRRLVLIGLPAAGLALLAWLVIFWREETQFPGAGPLPDLNRVHITVTGLGRCLALDQHLLARAQVTLVEKWYALRGWQPIAPLVAGWRLGKLSAGRFVYVEPLGRDAARIFQRQAICVQT